MSAPLREAFEDLATEAPEPGELAASTWAAGRRRRVRRRAGVVAVCVALVAAVVVVGPRLRHQPPPIGSDGSSGVHSYPQRIGHQTRAGAPTQAPGVLAATVTNNDFGNAFTVGVSTDGATHDIGYTDQWISPAGTSTASFDYQTGSDLTVTDLVTGRVRVYSDWRSQGFRVRSSQRLVWSPDQSQLLLTARPEGGKDNPAVLDLESGRLVAVGRGWPIGFASATEVVTMVRPAGQDPSLDPVVTTTDLLTGNGSQLTLKLASPWGESNGTVAASLSSSGETLLLIEDPRDGRTTATLRFFSMNDGSEQPARTFRNWEKGCPTAWIGEDPVLPTKVEGSAAGSVLVKSGGSESIVAVHPRLQSFCVRWAADALAGGPHQMLFGTVNYWWTWYWQPLAIALAVLLLGCGYLSRRRLRRRGRSSRLTERLGR